MEQKFNIDLLIITALPEEQKALQTVFGGKWTKTILDGIVFENSSLQTANRTLSIVIATQLDMGMPHAAITTTKAIKAYNPRLIVMTGICAGVEGKVELGDLVIASQIYDYGSGKLMEGKFCPHFTPVSPAPWLLQLLESFNDSEVLSSSIKSEFDGNKPKVNLSIHLASMGTGAAVISDDNFVQELTNHDRKLYGIDMEAYAVALAARLCSNHKVNYPCFTLKGVVDFAGIHKNDIYHDYGAYVSSAYLKKFLCDEISSEIFE